MQLCGTESDAHCNDDQVRIGMDLTRIALPTFVLEPRSLLDKLSDNYFHANLLSESVMLSLGGCLDVR